MEIIKEQKEYREERFEFSLFVNNNLICKRNFRINNYIEDSMSTIDFKESMDNIVNVIDNDLKSKSRVYTWYNFDENYTDDEFSAPLIEPWECTFKFVVTDNKKEMYTKIWDGRWYPKAIREKVDIANKTVKVLTKNGDLLTLDKESYFKENEGRLNNEMYLMKAMMNDKVDLLAVITKRICELCSPREDGYQNLKDYAYEEVYKTKDVVRDENGNPTGEFVKGDAKKKYTYSISRANAKLMAEWGQAVSEKTKAYFSKK